jgi:hypothetical protein
MPCGLSTYSITTTTGIIRYSFLFSSSFLFSLLSWDCFTGDLSATSVAGRAVACVLEVIGVLGLAIPVGVIGSELDRAYTKHFVR